MTQLYTEIQANIASRFRNFRKTAGDNLALVVVSIFDANSFSTHQIATSLAKITNKTFHNGENRLSNFLSTKTFEVGDKAFRNLVNLVFELLDKRGFFEGLTHLPINVDFTSHTDRFLILSASIPFFGRALPIYFSIRNYPKYSDQFSQIKMEQAFFLRLKHILPKKYRYILVMDRGFGNPRILSLMNKFDFDYVIRFKDNTKIKLGIEEIEISKLPKNSQKHTKIYLKTDSDQTPQNLIISFSKDKTLKQGWYLVSNLAFEQLQTIYKNRFQIEKTFQDEKSSGLDMEKSKITSYSRFKKLLFCAYLGQNLLLILGEYIHTNVGELKKSLSRFQEIP
jgi:hypothetical protein